MTKESKIQSLEKLIAKSSDIKVHNSSDGEFKSWKNLVERTLERIFGGKPTELEQFNKLVFYYNPGIWSLGADYSGAKHLQYFNRDFDIALKTIDLLIEELKEYEDEEKSEIIGK